MVSAGLAWSHSFPRKAFPMPYGKGDEVVVEIPGLPPTHAVIVRRLPDDGPARYLVRARRLVDAVTPV